VEKKQLSPPPEPTKIEINLGYKSTFSYQSVTANLGITDYVRKEETLDQAVDRIYNYVESKLMEKMDKTRQEVEAFYVKHK
jgi:hypothetical protein